VRGSHRGPESVHPCHGRPTSRRARPLPGPAPVARARRRPSAARARGGARRARPAGRARGPVARRRRLPARLRGQGAARRPVRLAGPVRRRGAPPARAAGPRAARPRAAARRRRRGDPRRPHPLGSCRRRAGARAAPWLPGAGIALAAHAAGPSRARRPGRRGRAAPRVRARAVHGHGLAPSAYRCGRVWGIRIEVAGASLYHQGSADLLDDELGRAPVDVFLAGVAGRSVTRDYWARVLPRLDPRVVLASHFDDFFRPLDARMGFATNVDLSGVPGEVAAVSRDARVATLPSPSPRPS
jgi:hypothetical protein